MARNLALIFTPLLFWLGVRAVQAWRNQSPTGVTDPTEEVKAQVTAGLAAPPHRGRGLADKTDTPATVRDLAAISSWAERALRRFGRDR